MFILVTIMLTSWFWLGSANGVVNGDKCLVNRTTATCVFDCNITTVDCTTSTETMANITVPGSTKVCSVTQTSGRDYRIIKCEFSCFNNMVVHTVRFSSGNCSTIVEVRAYLAVIPKALRDLNLTTGPQGMIVTGLMSDEPLIPVYSKRTVNIFVQQQVEDLEMQIPKPTRNRTKTTSKDLNSKFPRLHPNMNYSVTVRWRLTVGHLWSPAATGYIKTQPKEPTAAPALLKGLYSQSRAGNETVLYWQKIPKLRENGGELKYDIYTVRVDDPELMNIIENNNSFKKLKRLNISLEETDGNNGTVSVLRYRKTFEGWRISGIVTSVQPGDLVLINANNSVGQSNFYTAGKIISPDEVEIVPSSLTANMLDTTAFFNLTWRMPDRPIDNIHFYWCRGVWWQLQGWVECKDGISHKTMFNQSPTRPPSSTASLPSSSLPYHTHLINVSMEENHPTVCSGCYLHFGISLESQNISSPILWNVSLNTIEPDAGIDRESSSDLSKTELILIIIGSILAVLLVIVLTVGWTKRFRNFLKSYEIETPVSLNCSLSDASAGLFKVRNWEIIQRRSYESSDSGQGDSLSDTEMNHAEYSRFHLQTSNSGQLDINQDKSTKNCAKPRQKLLARFNQGEKRLSNPPICNGMYSMATLAVDNSEDIELSSCSIHEGKQTENSSIDPKDRVMTEEENSVPVLEIMVTDDGDDIITNVN